MADSASTSQATEGSAPAAAPPKLSKAEQRKELAAAETASRQLLLVLHSWPRFVPAVVEPLRAERGAAADAVLLLRAPVKVLTTLALVCHKAKAESTAERFKALATRLALVPPAELRAMAADWAGADEVAETLARAAPAQGGASGAAAPGVPIVVASELSTAVHAHAELLRTLHSDHPADLERGPWMYALNNGRSFALGPPNFGWTGALRPGRVSVRRPIPPSCAPNVPDYAESEEGVPSFEIESPHQMTPPVLSAAQAAKARKVARLGREILDKAHAAVRVGATTDELDRVVHEATVEAGAYPAPLNYRNFPKSVCTSVNEVVCHGIPDDRELRNGDIVNVDVTAILDGYYGDLNETFCVGDAVPADVKALVKCSHDALQKAIAMCAPGARYRDVGDVIATHVKKCGFSVDRTYCGHGIGETFHHAPSIPHYAGNKAKGLMKAGHCFTIEPMINMGSWRDKLWPDGWTAVTTDGKPSAQFEHMLLVTETGVEVLTARLPSSPPLWWEAGGEGAAPAAAE